MVPVILLGELGKKFGRRFMLDVKNPAEAVRALCANFPGFDKFVATSEERNVGYRVIVGREDIGIDDLHDPSGRQTIKIVPVVGGAGKVTKIIVGAILIAAAIWFPPLAGVTLYGTTTLAAVSFSIGVSLVLGGVIEMLAPQPKTDGPGPEDMPSYTFNGPINTTAQGYPVPVGFGRMIVGSAVISAGQTVEEMAV
jgi:predicted phage tail protein